MSDLDDLLERHRATPFPERARGEHYGEVDAVMIDADIFGWCSRAVGSLLNPDERHRFQVAHDELARSLTEMPPEVRPYYEQLLLLASTALRDNRY